MTLSQKKARPSKRRQMHRINRVHFVGVGGAGMSGIAEVLLNQGYEVTGSDIRASAATERLSELGAKIMIGHDESHVAAADVLVVSSAIDDDNAEVAAARERRIPLVPRAEMLGELMRFRQGIAVAGTHGKTTTTSLAASLLAEGGLDPTFVIGGLLNTYGAHARLGEGEYLVAEADESDGSFLLLQPTMAVITNIDRDHLEAYDNSFSSLRRAFLDFTHHLPFYGLVVACMDDAEVARLLPELSRPMITYGLSEEADVRASDIRQDGLKMHFLLHLPGQSEACAVTLNLPGVHNVRNALGAIAVAYELGVDVQAVQRALSEFGGIGRRFAPVATLPVADGDALVMEDYGHHPSEIQATLEAARGGWPERRVVLVFQPHRYSRTQDLFDDFAQVLSTADVLVVTDIYAAGEVPIAGISSRALCRAVRARGRVDPILVPDIEQVTATLADVLRADDLVLLMGAGSVGQLASTIRDHGLHEESS